MREDLRGEVVLDQGELEWCGEKDLRIAAMAADLGCDDVVLPRERMMCIHRRAAPITQQEPAVAPALPDAVRVSKREQDADVRVILGGICRLLDAQPVTPVSCFGG